MLIMTMRLYSYSIQLSAGSYAGQSRDKIKSPLFNRLLKHPAIGRIFLEAQLLFN